jgi:hypothetical protein
MYHMSVLIINNNKTGRVDSLLPHYFANDGSGILTSGFEICFETCQRWLVVVVCCSFTSVYDVLSYIIRHLFLKILDPFS